MLLLRQWQKLGMISNNRLRPALRLLSHHYYREAVTIPVLQRCSLSTTTSTSTDIAAIPNNNPNHLPSKLIDFKISSKIEGEESQIATVKLRPGEVLRAESGSMLFMTEGIEMDTKMEGMTSAFTRMMTGQNVFLTDFTYTKEKGEGTIGLGTSFPSKILRLTLQDYDNSTLICQRGAYLASNPSVDIQMEYTKSLTSGFFGGQGFILQRLSGEGDVLVTAGGTLVEKELKDGEVLRVTSGSIVAFTSTVDYDVQMMPGIKNAMFGGEGLFVTTLKGPGKVWLQGMPADRMIAEIARRVPSGGPGIGIPIGLGAGGSGDGDGSEGDVGPDVAAEGAAADAAVAGAGGEEMVAASDEAIQADRQATVASSGFDPASESNLDSESPSALFGDAAEASSNSNEPHQDTASFATSSEDNFSKETGSQSDETMFTDDSTSFSDDNSFSNSEDNFGNDDTFFEDSTTTDVFDSAPEEAAEGGSSILSTLWSIFSDDDD